MAHTPEDIWAEMRLHMEWSEGFSLCVLFSPGASATEQIVQWADDAWAWLQARGLVDAARTLLLPPIR